MNNARVVERKEIQTPQQMWRNKRIGEVLTILEAIDAVQTFKPYVVLQEKVFGGLEQAIISQLRSSIGEKTIALQGELRVVEKFVNLNKLRDIYQLELSSLRQYVKEGNDN